VALLAVAGCGGGGGHTTATTAVTGERVSGPGFVFRAPTGWTVKSEVASAAAAQGTQSVAVYVLTTLKAYKPALFTKSIAELDRIANSLAARSKGQVTGSRTVTSAGEQARQYDIQTGGVVDEYTFVFRAKHEYQLTCQWEAASGVPAACAQLVASFRFG